MSKTIVSIEEIQDVKPHPNADRLEIVQILGYQVVTGKGKFQPGDLATYFPPDLLLPEDVAEKMEVTNYLKHAVFPGNEEKTQCRVGAVRLRGQPSHGFVFGARDFSDVQLGQDVTEAYGALKYEPPPRQTAGDALDDLPAFHKYTEIENYQRYPEAMPEGIEVSITEKIHGTNCRMGYVRDENGEFTYCAGSHKLRRAEPGEGEEGLYWLHMGEDLRYWLKKWSADKHDVVVFGEIFGKGVQDLSYGLKGKGLRVFDITVDGVYLDHEQFLQMIYPTNLDLVPELYRGPFKPDLVEEHTYGDTTFDTTDKFKGREGCVIRPLEEQHSDVLGGRLILKSVSVDYRDRRGAKDIGE